MPKTNRLYVAAAGSGKTTLLVKEALNLSQSQKVLITTYTEANESEIKRKIAILNRGIFPANIKVQTWFSFLIQHGIKPYQGTCNEVLFSKSINGLLLTQTQSACRNPSSKGKKIYWGETDFEKFYITSNGQVYSDKVAKLVIRCNEKSNGKVVQRISKIFDAIFVDEVQDLAGYDLDILQLFFNSTMSVYIAGDPRQVTYLTHHERKHSQYKNGRIKDFVTEKCKKSNVEIDETTLTTSHRNNQKICDFSSKLYPFLPAAKSCECDSCKSSDTSHCGVFVVSSSNLAAYIERYSPTILRYSKAKASEWTYGKSKGLTFDHVLIYPSEPIVKYLKNGSLTKVVKGVEKDAFDISRFYVAITRARHSTAIVCDFVESDNFIDGISKYSLPLADI